MQRKAIVNNGQASLPGAFERHTIDPRQQIDAKRRVPQLDNLIGNKEVFLADAQAPEPNAAIPFDQMLGISRVRADQMSKSPVWRGRPWSAMA